MPSMRKSMFLQKNRQRGFIFGRYERVILQKKLFSVTDFKTPNRKNNEN
jgi:hypothetical protein